MLCSINILYSRESSSGLINLFFGQRSVVVGSDDLGYERVWVDVVVDQLQLLHLLQLQLPGSVPQSLPADVGGQDGHDRSQVGLQLLGSFGCFGVDFGPTFLFLGWCC